MVDCCVLTDVAVLRVRVDETRTDWLTDWLSDWLRCVDWRGGRKSKSRWNEDWLTDWLTDSGVLTDVAVVSVDETRMKHERSGNFGVVQMKASSIPQDIF